MIRRNSFSRNSILFVCLLVTISCLSVTIISVYRLPDIISLTSTPPNKQVDTNNISKFGEMMVNMLPEDLAFTIFMPSEGAFERLLKLSDSLVIGGDMYNSSSNTFAVISRILGFSVVPRMIVAGEVREEVRYDSLSGFGLFVIKDLDGMLVVNGVRSERVDIRKGKIVVHIMDGVIMDAEFEQSVLGDDGEQV